MKRIMALLTVALVVAAMSAPAALAQEQVADENCTFANGKTTCTESVLLGHHYVFTQTEFWHLGNDVWETRCVDYHVDVFETTTTVYKGKSDKVLRTQTTITESEPYFWTSQLC